MKKYILFSLLVLVPLFIYMHSFYDAYITWDDGVQVYENSEVKNFGFESFKIILSSNTAGMYQPLTSICFGILASIYGVSSAFTFHVFSFVVHILNTFLVYFLGIRLFKKNKLKAFLLALLFTSQPMSIDAVSWVSATSTLLFSLFFLISLHCYILFLEKENQKQYLFSVLAFFLGCLCKVQIIPLVGVLFLIDFLLDKPLLNKKMWLQKIPYLFIAFIFGLVALSFRSVTLVATSALEYNKVYFALNQFIGYVIELVSLPHYALLRSNEWILHGQAFLFFILGVGVYCFRKNKLFVFGVLFFLMNLVLQTTLFSKFNNPYGRRYVYVAGLGVWIAILSFNYKKRHIYIASLFILFQVLAAKATSVGRSANSELFVSLSSVKTKEQLGSTDFSAYAFEHHAKTINGYDFSPELSASSGLNNLGIVMARFGFIDFAEICFIKNDSFESEDNLVQLFLFKDIEKAETYLLKSFKNRPNSFDLCIKLGYVYLKTNAIKAEGYFKRAIAINPNSAIGYMNLGVINSKKNKPKAEEYFLKALTLDSKNIKLLKNLGVFYKETNPEKSEQYYKQAKLVVQKNNWN
ncbi:glycosyltransferase family 39 protein [Flavicella sediminum]|uniref:glycosyltransferase family 39 protein n=1 Tax=Flavicella sediminum TaxID=2585141 RepID=UPI0011205F6A|nr:glycosyltransferase family 39 protein [Flavicella sediminum]